MQSHHRQATHRLRVDGPHHGIRQLLLGPNLLLQLPSLFLSPGLGSCGGCGPGAAQACRLRRGGSGLGRHLLRGGLHAGRMGSAAQPRSSLLLRLRCAASTASAALRCC